MSQKSLVVHMAFEVAPFSKHGGLADVVGSLPIYLQSDHLENIILSPFYFSAMSKTCSHSLNHTGCQLLIPYMDKIYNVSVLLAYHRGLRLIFLSEPIFFDRDDIYHMADGKPYEDSTERAGFFAKAAYYCIKEYLGNVDQIIFHDWHGAGFLAYMEKNSKRPKTTYVIHNFEFQGHISSEQYSRLDPPLGEAFKGILVQGRPLTFAALALDRCDNIVAVSPTYRDELVSGHLPHHLTLGLFGQSVQQKLHGFLNGIDPMTWSNRTPGNPKDRLAQILKEKAAAAAKVREWTSLELGKPLALMMCRLVRQKGIELFFGSEDKLLSKALSCFNIIICGQPGENPREVDAQFRYLESTYKNSLAYLNYYEDSLAKVLFKAADLFLLPSLFEPCGLTQMYAMAQGTIPVARATGGLKDTIVDEATNPGFGTGFLFEGFSSEEFFGAIERAGLEWRKNEHWIALMERAIAQDNSWERRAIPYRHLLG